MRSEPFQKLYKQCNAGNSREKLDHLPPFPTHIDIEITNCCNFKCIMCPTGTGYQRREKGYMRDELYYQILNEIKGYKTPLRFIRWGEPTLHPKWLQYIEAAKKLNIMCHINTNGSMINEKNVQALIDLELDSLKFSFQGVDRENYSEIRNIDFFQELFEKVRLVFQSRGGKNKPFLYVSTTVTTETEEQIANFKERFSEFCDKISVWSTFLDHIDIKNMKVGEDLKKRIMLLKKNQTIKKIHGECPEVFDKLSINWDGTISACCRDFDNLMIVGDLKKNSLKEIWRSKKMNIYRTLLARGEHDKIKLCSSCYTESVK